MKQDVYLFRKVTDTCAHSLLIFIIAAMQQNTDQIA